MNDYLSDAFAPPAAPTIIGVPMGVHAVRVVRTVNPQAGTVVARDTIVFRPSSTTPAGLWF